MASRCLSITSLVAPPQDRGGDPVPRKVLVIEDDPSARRLLGYALKQEGYEVLLAPNGLDGLKKAFEGDPDLVILDVMLPGVDGFEVCCRLRADPRTEQLPILMLSAKGQQADKATGLKVGANDYMVKPAAPSDLISSVQSLLVQRVQGAARAIAFLGAKGGVGTSTVAVNVAIAISQRDKRVILVDLCPYSGTVAALLGLKPELTIAGLFADSTDTIDPHDLEEALITHDSGLRVLASAQTAAEYRGFSPSQSEALFNELRQMADYIITDVSAYPSEAEAMALGKCHPIIVVTGSKADSLASASSAAALVDRLGIAQERLGTVVVDRDGLLPEAEPSKLKEVIESTTQIRLLAIIPYDTKAPFEFEARGTPVTLAEPNRPMALSLKGLADVIVDGDGLASGDRPAGSGA